MTKYYDDPLAAAYMGREFGVDYWCKEKRNKIKGDDYFVGVLDGDVGYYDFCSETPEVHPDSLHIYTPIIGDTMFLKDNHVGWLAEYGEIEQAGDRVMGNVNNGNWKIIQRNGLPFFNPKVET